MPRDRSYHLTREEKIALTAALIFFALVMTTVFVLRVGSYLDVPQHEIIVVISPANIPPSLYSWPQSLSSETKKTAAITIRPPRKATGGVPVPVAGQTCDTLELVDKTGEVIAGASSDTSSGSKSSPQSIIDSLIILYPGFKQFALREEMKKTRPVTKKDSLLAWAKNDLAEKLARQGKIDPAILKQLSMLQRYQNHGPYYVVFPGIGPGMQFDYTKILKSIISIFEKPPDD